MTLGEDYHQGELSHEPRPMLILSKLASELKCRSRIYVHSEACWLEYQGAIQQWHLPHFYLSRVNDNPTKSLMWCGFREDWSLAIVFGRFLAVWENEATSITASIYEQEEVPGREATAPRDVVFKLYPQLLLHKRRLSKVSKSNAF